MIEVNRNIGYTAREIATPITNLLCWTEGNDVQNLQQEAHAEGFTVLPVLESGEIIGEITLESLTDTTQQNKPKHNTIHHQHLIAADTPILHLIELFAVAPKQHFYVLGSSKIIGMVTPADLNKVHARASFYLLVAHFESLLTEFITTRYGGQQEHLARYLSENRIDKAVRIRQQDQQSDLDLPLIHYVNLVDLITLVAKHAELRGLLGFENRKQVESAFSFSHVRNAVAHVNNLLVTSHEDIQRINQDCKDMIKYRQRIAENI
jgi:hypothetical protein